MADSLLNTSISAIVTNATNKIPTATVDELVQIASAIDDIGKDEDSTLETAINSRINTLMGGSPTISDVQKLGRVIRRMTDETVASQAGNTDNLSEGTTNLYYTDARFDSRLQTQLPNTDSLTEGSTNLYYTDARTRTHITSADLDMGGNKVLFGNLYSTEADLPSASAYHGMFAHVHATGKAYFAHAGVWHKLIDETSSTTTDLSEGTNQYYTDARVQTKLGSVSGHILPDTDVTYDLGSSTNKFRDLYLSGSSLKLGDATISAEAGGAMNLPADSKLGDTPTASDNTTKIATTAFVSTAISNLIDSAPGALNTLNELAAALGDDENFSTTITNSIATKANTSSLSTVATSGNFSDLSSTPTTLAGYGITDGGNDSFQASGINKIYFQESQPSITQIGELWFQPSLARFYKAIANTNTQTVDAGQVSSAPNNITFPAAGSGGTSIALRFGAYQNAVITFTTPLNLVSFTGGGSHDTSLVDVTMEDGTVHTLSNGYNFESYSGGVFNNGRVASIKINTTYSPNNSTMNIVTSGAPVWELIAVNGVPLSTSDLSEGTNLYYTDARVDSRISSQVTPFPYSAITQSLIPSVDSDGTTGVDLGSSSKKWRDLYLSGNTLHLGAAQITADAGTIKLPTGSVILDSGGSPQVIPSALEELTNVDLIVPSENMTIAVDETDAGMSPASGWEWSWNATSLPYARSTILNQTQGQIPLYKGSTYQVRNFAANVTSGNATQTHKIYLKWIDGAGLDNLVSWSTSLLSQTISFPGVRSGATLTGQVLNITVPSTVTPPTLTPPTVTYNVGADTGVYQFSGANSGDNPSIGPLYKGGTYTFTLDSTVSGHPFYLTTDDGANFVSNSFVGEYTSGVTGSRNSSGDVVFTVPSDAPSTLYYQCGIHSAMKGTITIKDLAVETDADSNYVLYFQHTQEGHKNSVPIKPKPTIADQMCIVYNSTTNNFEPQDLMQYIDDTAQFKAKIEGLASDQITAKINDNTLVGTSTLSTSIKNDVEFIANLNQQGELQTFTGTARWYAPFDLQMTAVTGNLSTAADATVGLRINKNNAQTTTINILANQTSGTAALQTFTLSAGDYLTVDVLSIGNSTKGAGLVVQFKYKRV